MALDILIVDDERDIRELVAGVLSDEGYGSNEYIHTTKPIVIVTGPGPGSGKLATCLGQLYHEYKRGVKAGYAKFETFPIWSIPLKHPVNVAYESATVDLRDFNLVEQGAVEVVQPLRPQPVPVGHALDPHMQQIERL